MKIYTSYYSNFKNIPENLLCIGISRYIPEEFRTTEIKNFLYTPNSILAPSEELLSDIKNQNIDNDEYTRRYYKEMFANIKRLTKSSATDYASIANDYFPKMISEMEKNNSSEFEGIVLMCYEKPNEFCHRHLVAAVMNKIGFNVTEWQPKKERIVESNQNELF